MANLDIIKKSLKKTLNRHKDKFENFFDGWSGWEKWLQVELAYELNNHGVATVEKQYGYHKGKRLPIGKLGNTNAFIDIVFRKKKDSTDYLTAIELTVGETQKSLRKVFSDLLKINALKQKEWDFRSVFVVLAFKNRNGRNTKFVELYNAIQYKFDIAPIDFGCFTFLVFGWEPPALKCNMNGANYGEWIESLVEIYKAHHIIAKVSTKKSYSKKLEVQDD